MVLQYKERKEKSSWKDYPGKKHLEKNPEHYDFRLLNHEKKKE